MLWMLKSCSDINVDLHGYFAVSEELKNDVVIMILINIIIDPSTVE